MSKVIEIKLPRAFMNCGVTECNHFISDTNYSKDFDNIKFPLPKGKWNIIHFKENNRVILRDNRNALRRFINV
jgi:hypothetical protein